MKQCNRAVGFFISKVLSVYIRLLVSFLCSCLRKPLHTLEELLTQQWADCPHARTGHPPLRKLCTGVSPERRAATFKKRSWFEMQVRSCSSCGYVIVDPSRPCPSCGVVAPLLVAAPDLRAQPQQRNNSPLKIKADLRRIIVSVQAPLSEGAQRGEVRVW